MTVGTPSTTEITDSNSWYALDPGATVRYLNSSVEHGLSSQEAERRLHEYGPNQLAESKPPTFWQLLWEQLNSFVIIMLMVAAVISAALGDFIEAAVIAAIVVLNAALGVIQERRAEQAGAGQLFHTDGEAHLGLAGLDGHDGGAQGGGAGGAGVAHVVDD